MELGPKRPSQLWFWDPTKVSFRGLPLFWQRVGISGLLGFGFRVQGLEKGSFKGDPFKGAFKGLGFRV